MKVGVLVALVLSACAVDSTGLLEPDAASRFDAARIRDSGSDIQRRDVNIADTSVLDVGGDVPADVFDGSTDSAPDVMPDAGPTPCDDPELTACYLFENDVTDGSAAGNDLTGVDVTYLAMGAAGAAVTLGPMSELSLRDSVLGLPADYTIELWFRMDTAIPGGVSRWGVLDDNDGLAIFLYDRGGDTTRVTMGRGFVDVDTRGWHHLVLVSTPTEAYLRVDGRDFAVTRDRPINVVEGIHVGSDATPSADVFNQKFIGNIDDIRIWNRAFSNEEVVSLFE